MADPAGWLTDTLALYRRVFRQGAALAIRNVSAGLVVIVYQVLLAGVALVAAPLGFVGGILLYLATVACLSSWLALAGEVIRSGRVRLADLPASFVAYLNDLLMVFFLLFGLQLLGSLVLAAMPVVYLVFVLAVFVFLNAVPELIYLGRHPAAALLVESYRFIGENWIEWFPLNVVLVAVFLAVRDVVPAGPFGLVEAAALGVVLYFVTLVRGLLFLELSTSTRRSREFRRRSAG